MFKKIKFYIIAGLLLIAGLILLFNKFLLIGLIAIGIAVTIYAIWEFLLKEKVKQNEILNQKLLDKERENKRLRETVEDYSKRKLNISEVNTVLELGLFEVKTNFKKTIKRKVDDENKDIRFVGVINVDFVAKYGVDFRKIKFRIDENKQEISLVNANPEFLAFTKRTCKWEVEEILEYNIPLLGMGYWRTNTKLDKIANNIKEEVRLQVEHESENGPEELKWIIEPLREHVERALLLILGAQGYKVEFAKLEGPGYKSFQEYANNSKTEQMNKNAIPNKHTLSLDNK